MPSISHRVLKDFSCCVPPVRITNTLCIPSGPRVKISKVGDLHVIAQLRMLRRTARHVNLLQPVLNYLNSISWSYKRSEEHTSELQSRGHLVCRLLLEKKKYRRTKD